MQPITDRNGNGFGQNQLSNILLLLVLTKNDFNLLSGYSCRIPLLQYASFEDVKNVSNYIAASVMINGRRGYLSEMKFHLVKNQNVKCVKLLST